MVLSPPFVLLGLAITRVWCSRSVLNSLSVFATFGEPSISLHRYFHQTRRFSIAFPHAAIVHLGGGKLGRSLITAEMTVSSWLTFSLNGHMHGDTASVE